MRDALVRYCLLLTIPLVFSACQRSETNEPESENPSDEILTVRLSANPDGSLQHVKFRVGEQEKKITASNRKELTKRLKKAMTKLEPEPEELSGDYYVAENLDYGYLVATIDATRKHLTKSFDYPGKAKHEATRTRHERFVRLTVEGGEPKLLFLYIGGGDQTFSIDEVVIPLRIEIRATNDRETAIYKKAAGGLKGEELVGSGAKGIRELTKLSAKHLSKNFRRHRDPGKFGCELLVDDNVPIRDFAKVFDACSNVKPAPDKKQTVWLRRTKLLGVNVEFGVEEEEGELEESITIDDSDE